MTYAKEAIVATPFFGLGLASGAAIQIPILFACRMNSAAILQVGILVLGIVWAWIGFVVRRSNKIRTKG